MCIQICMIKMCDTRIVFNLYKKNCIRYKFVQDLDTNLYRFCVQICKKICIRFKFIQDCIQICIRFECKFVQDLHTNLYTSHLGSWSMGESKHGNLEVSEPRKLRAWKPMSLCVLEHGSLEVSEPGSQEHRSLEASEPGRLEHGSLGATEPRSLESGAWEPGSLGCWEPWNLKT